MEGDGGRIRARVHIVQVPALAVRILVIKERVVRHVADTHGVEALHREEVFAAVAAQVLGALMSARDEDVHSLARQHLKRSHEVEPEVDVLQVQCCGTWRSETHEVGAEAVWQEDSISIYLDGPSMLAVDAVRLNLLPDADENVSVHDGLPGALRYADALVDFGGVATEDADTLLLHHAHQLLLIAGLHARCDDTLGRHHGEAEERGGGQGHGLYHGLHVMCTLGAA
mmetsp:Transcript_66874/g.192242  ORF Transcript_66874/g.192242 Transcript_66874/m.192242 type:complete len:227 (-) Transcript_66874:619-1299(-)